MKLTPKTFIQACIGPFLGIILIDQVLKLIVEKNFMLGESVEVFPFFAITYVRNEGAAWGILSGAQYELAIIGVIAIILCTLFWKKIIGTQFIFYPFGALLYGGIVGNMIDRLRLNYVVDFFDFHIGEWHFPCFNVADISICISVAAIIFFQLYFDYKAKRVENV